MQSTVWTRVIRRARVGYQQDSLPGLLHRPDSLCCSPLLRPAKHRTQADASPKRWPGRKAKSRSNSILDARGRGPLCRTVEVKFNCMGCGLARFSTVQASACSPQTHSKGCIAQDTAKKVEGAPVSLYIDTLKLQIWPSWQMQGLCTPIQNSQRTSSRAYLILNSIIHITVAFGRPASCCFYLTRTLPIHFHSFWTLQVELFIENHLYRARILALFESTGWCCLKQGLAGSRRGKEERGYWRAGVCSKEFCRCRWGL